MGTLLEDMETVRRLDEQLSRDRRKRLESGGKVALDPNCSTDTLLFWMQCRGSSLQLNYGEDTGNWECSWITGGRRFTCVSRTSRGAIYGAVEMAILDCETTTIRA